MSVVELHTESSASKRSQPELSTVEAVHSILRHCHDCADLGIVVGPPGQRQDHGVAAL